MRRAHLSVIGGLALGMLSSQTSLAYDLPSLNLGFTSFLDGAPPSGPGWYAQQYVQLYRSARLKDGDGDNSAIPDRYGRLRTAEVDANIGLTQLVYQSDQPLLLDGKWGLNLMLPYASLELDPDNGPIQASGANLGDLLVGPFLQWDPIMGPNGPRFVQRVELQMIFPTGDYDADKAINPGSNVFSFDPYWAATFFATPKWTISWRLHYLWNAKNDDPFRLLGADDTQAGQAVHLNFASAYEVIPQRLRLGLNGYYLKEFTDKRIDGDRISDSQEQVLGLGPGLVYHLSKHDHLFFNAYWETAAENRPEGGRFNLRYVHHFH
ncbi:SphA family protein [Halochromatium glycolicum]|uniref:Phenol degradation protein meta n=1 Tax=Halochromatium glycolicum TaxID=85075 RepID=A0AAJ0U740_9GAMM|nr:transporter [Halochromatium glycolicum]MBK1706427.1 phenol degradation protein meta [Halochromatium glycolicum]